MSNALISTAQTFYTALSDNNTKEWWAQNRGTYDEHLKPAALALCWRISRRKLATDRG